MHARERVSYSKLSVSDAFHPPTPQSFLDDHLHVLQNATDKRQALVNFGIDLSVHPTFDAQTRAQIGDDYLKAVPGNKTDPFDVLRVLLQECFMWEGAVDMYTKDGNLDRLRNYTRAISMAPAAVNWASKNPKIRAVSDGLNGKEQKRFWEKTLRFRKRQFRQVEKALRGS